MRSRFLLLVLLLTLVPAGVAWAQSSAGPYTTLTVTSPTLGPQAARTISITHAEPNSGLTVVLFDPNGSQAVMTENTDGSGDVTLTLQAPPAGWTYGVYRVAIATRLGRSISTTFPVDSGAPELFAGPGLPSPVSVFVLSGTGLPASTTVDLTLTLASGYGTRPIQVTTDEDGSFVTFLWPQTFGFPYWSAGPYTVTQDGGNASLTFWVREHPDTSYLSIQPPSISGSLTSIAYQHYQPGRYLWTVFADSQGSVLGQYLVGPVDANGSAEGAVTLHAPASGQYLLATPYDWGETEVEVDMPTSTPTSTPTITPSPTATATPTPRPTHTPRPTATAKPRPTATPKPRPSATPKPTARRRPTATRKKTVSCKKRHGKQPKRCKR
jgi:hypothetical protein